MQAEAAVQHARSPGLDTLRDLFASPDLHMQDCADGVPTVWVGPDDITRVMQALKSDYPMLHDLFAIDERVRERRAGQPDADFTVVYHLMSFRHNADPADLICGRKSSLLLFHRIKRFLAAKIEHERVGLAGKAVRPGGDHNRAFRLSAGN